MSKLTPHHVLAPGTHLHWYVVQHVLGYGGFGITYLAEDPNLAQRVAIKEYFPAGLATRAADGSVAPRTPDDTELFNWGRDRFLAEARTLASLNHPNIVSVLSVFEAYGSAYMVMRFEPGKSLGQLLREGRQFEEPEVRVILEAMLSALDAVHEGGFVHRDVKPDNIFIRDDGTPLLLDFGSARQVVGSATKALTALVSPGYAPLEQYDDNTSQTTQGPWTDIYALAATLYRLVIGRAPPDAVTRAHNAINGNERDASSNITHPGFSAGLLHGIGAGLAIAARDRPSSISAWRALIEDVPDARAEPPVDWRLQQGTGQVVFPPGVR